MSTEFRDLTGQVFKGYELRQLIGRGGFGAVYRAYQPLVERDVAIKIILPEYANHPNFVRRFEAEAQFIAQLEHIHIVPLYDYWREPDTACLVMRWLRGGSLQDAIDQRGAWDVNATARLLDQLAAALAAAHRRGIIHRDLKPANVLLDEADNGYLADFGIAKNLVAEPESNAEEDRFGSPAYISPEQVTGQPVSPQTDIYSLGVLLYMVLTGRTPFLDPSTTTVIRRHLSEPLPPLQGIRPELPHALNMVIWRATSKRPEARYPDALSLAGDFRRIISPDASFSVLPNVPSPTAPKLTISPAGKTLPVDLPLEPENPYKGLRAFQEADAHDFFGRKTLVDRLLKRLSEPDENARFLAVVGPSGSGKSSAVKAGLIPMVRHGGAQGSQDWFIAQMTPGAQPIVELEAALLRVAVNPPPTLLDELRASERGLVEVVGRLLPVEDGELLLVIDQFEEIFTLTSSESERTHFLNSLLAATTDPTSRFRLVITLRADFYDRPLLYPEFGDLMRRRTEIVLPLTSVEIEQAILGPAERIGLRFEPGLMSAIVADVSQQPGGLPLLQFALTELFERRDGFNLTQAAYAGTGGVLGALARRADEVYDQLDSVGQESARQLFLRLVTLGEGTEDTRRRILQSELLTASAVDKRSLQNVIENYLKFRLLTADYEPTTRTPTIEIAHEALIRVWGRLKSWLNANRDNLRLYQRLATATTEWLNTGRDPSYLASGARLAQFEFLASGAILSLTQEESEYLSASIAARQRAANRLRLFVAGLAVFSIVALVFAWFALDRQRAADIQASISRSRELAVTALTGVQQTDLALLLSLEALRSADTFEARNSLLTALQAQPRIERYLQGPTAAAVRTLAVSPDGRLIVSGGADNTLIIWDIQNNTMRGTPLVGHTGWVNSVAFSPDGTLIASASIDQTVRLWDANTGAPVSEPLRGHTDSVWSVAFSPNGQLLASSSADMTIMLWDVSTGSPLGDPLTGHEDIIYALAFSPDGKVLASGSGDATIRLWDTTTWEPIGEPLNTADWVLSLAFSPGTGLLASTGADGNVTFWDTSTGEELNVVNTGHQDYVRQVVFSPDSRFFATASQDNTIRVWDASTGEPVGDPLTEHSDDVWSAAFLPDSDTLVSGGADGKIIEWNIGDFQPMGRLLADHREPVLAVAFSPDGKTLASAGGSVSDRTPARDNIIHLWDTATGTVKTTLEGHQWYVSSIAYSPDGNILASASADQTIRLWNLDTGETRQSIDIPNPSRWTALAFSPDGKWLAFGDEAGEIYFWDIASATLNEDPLIGHTADIMSLTFSPDSRFLASGSKDRTIILWDISKREMVSDPLVGHTDNVNTVAFSPDGKYLASGSDDETIILWDVATGKPTGQPFVGQKDYVTSLAFSPDGQLLTSGGYDNNLLLWDVNVGERIGGPFVGHTAPINSIAFSPDGQTVATGSLDSTVILWDANIDAWERRACNIANRSLTASEWERYFQGTPYRLTCPVSSPQ